MSHKVSQQLLSLTHIDAKIEVLSNKREQINQKRNEFVSGISERRAVLTAWESAHREGAQRQETEEHRLRDETEKIVERRKQLTGLGGAKAAKIMEREIDISARTIQLMEERAMKALEEVDELQARMQDVRVELERLEHDFEAENQQMTDALVEIDDELKSHNIERADVVKGLDERLLRLYTRVKSRYPADAVAVAESGACRSCFRALPAQTYNQVLAGNVYIQCPGCSRLLVSLAQP